MITKQQLEQVLSALQYTSQQAQYLARERRISIEKRMDVEQAIETIKQAIDDYDKRVPMNFGEIEKALPKSIRRLNQPREIFAFIEGIRVAEKHHGVT